MEEDNLDFFFNYIFQPADYRTVGSDKFLMTGKLHLPIPMMILAGPIYRGQLSIMTILFLSTIILTGPAWCSQLCYFGAFNNLASGGKTSKEILRFKGPVKATVLFLVITVAIILRWMMVSMLVSTLVAVAFGVTGIMIMILILTISLHAACIALAWI